MVPHAVKLTFVEQGVIYIDGKAKPTRVDNEDRDADLTIRLSLEDFRRILDREVTGRRLVLSGRAKIRGDIRIATQLDRMFKL